MIIAAKPLQIETTLLLTGYRKSIPTTYRLATIQHYWHTIVRKHSSKSSKVDDFDVILTPVCNFLLVISSNLGPISQRLATIHSWRTNRRTDRRRQPCQYLDRYLSTVGQKVKCWYAYCQPRRRKFGTEINASNRKRNLEEAYSIASWLEMVKSNVISPLGLGVEHHSPTFWCILAFLPRVKHLRRTSNSAFSRHFEPRMYGVSRQQAYWRLTAISEKSKINTWKVLFNLGMLVCLA